MHGGIENLGLSRAEGATKSSYFNELLPEPAANSCGLALIDRNIRLLRDLGPACRLPAHHVAELPRR